MHIAHGFEKRLRNYRLESLDTEKATIYGLWPDYTLACYNEAWVRFARENGGDPSILRDWGLGANVMDAVPSCLRPFYEGLYRRCASGFQTQGFSYECSSDTVFRRFSQLVYPLKDGAFLTVHSCLVEHPHSLSERVPHAPDPLLYRRDGVIHQCCHCGRVRNLKYVHRWDWVPVYVRTPDRTTHYELCPPCRGYFRQLSTERPDAVLQGLPLVE